MPVATIPANKLERNDGIDGSMICDSPEARIIVNFQEMSTSVLYLHSGFVTFNKPWARCGILFGESWVRIVPAPPAALRRDESAPLGVDYTIPRRPIVGD